MLTPKAGELVADPYRFGGDKDKAKAFFEEGLAQAFEQMRQAQHPDYPLTAYYAFKQAESDEEEGESKGLASVVASTGWETILEGLFKARFAITGTWPMRTERRGRLRDTDSNALSSSIVLVCRPRPVTAQVGTRQEPRRTTAQDFILADSSRRAS